MKKFFGARFRLEYVWLSLILVFAFFLRVFGLGKSSLWVDEATSSVVALNILGKGIPVFDSGFLYGRAYLFHYLEAFFLLFGHSEFWARFVSVLIGLGIVLLAYFIGREYSKSGGLVSALFMSVFYLEVFYSRQARFYQLFSLLFFLAVYFLYKSKDNPRFLYLALVTFVVALNTQIAAAVLAPFFILHILVYSKGARKFFSAVPFLFLVEKFFPVRGLSGESARLAVDYAGRYASYTSNMIYMLVLFVPGVLISFFKKKRLTLLLVLPCLVLLLGVFSLEVFAFRYAYFAVFPLVLYFSLLLSYLYEKYGKLILVVIFVLLVFPSNLFFPYTFVNVIKPVDYAFLDSSAPVTDYKNLPEDLLVKLRSEDVVLVSYFSSDVEWNIRKPDYVLPFSMDGRGSDQVSYNSSRGKVDIYSGALILESVPEGDYYVLVDRFSVSKLKGAQKEFLEELVLGCEVVFGGRGFSVYECF